MDSVPALHSRGLASSLSASSLHGGSYARRAQRVDPKSSEKRRLLADRNAYIAHLEAQVERANEAALDAGSMGAALQQVRARVEDLEVQVAQQQQGQSQQPVAGPSLGTDRTYGTEWRAASAEVDGPLRFSEARVYRLEQAVGEAHATTEAENARLRNEVSLAVQELGQRMDERVWQMREHVDSCLQASQRSEDGAAEVVREAQGTCARLTDDALAAAEASQRKVEDATRKIDSCQQKLQDLSKETETGLEAVRKELAALMRARPADVSQQPAPTAPNIPASVPASLAPLGAFGVVEPVAQPEPTLEVLLQQQAMHLSCSGSNQAPMAVSPQPEHIEQLVEALERRLATRLGQQVLQLSEVLRRVVQAQSGLQQQVTARGVAAPMSSSSTPGPTGASPAWMADLDPSPAVGVAASVEASAATRGNRWWVASETQRRAAIDELYHELRQLEAHGPSSSTDEPKRSVGRGRFGLRGEVAGCCSQESTSASSQHLRTPRPRSSWR